MAPQTNPAGPRFDPPASRADDAPPGAASPARTASDAPLSRRGFVRTTALALAALEGCGAPALGAGGPARKSITMQRPFTFRAAYNWADTFAVEAPNNFARGGRLVGSWSWQFADGQRGNTHFTSTSFFRLNPYRLSGLIAFDMWELDRSARGEHRLFVSYEGLSTTPEGVTTIEAAIVGGTGLYAAASGGVKWVSRNGFIDEGSGALTMGR
jgi:hypothetical protein